MFTGIVEETGVVTSIEQLPEDAARITVDGKLSTSDAALGDSICVSGVCLTVTELDGTQFSADVMKPTLDATVLGRYEAGSPVNLERATKASTRIGGHVVTGHVDCVAAVVSRTVAAHWETLRFALAEPHWRQLAPKGSVAIDGASLTVGDVGVDGDAGHWFEVSLIPTTLAHTTLGRLAVGSQVNVETDVLAKYVQRFLESDKKP